ncbi:NAD(+) diphosphatase [Lysinimonas soli]|uniref:NAD(+) diphosphatase n=1 Tax=Lysinimonas soli TaxID=1074233 RepID=A0ABW0NP73_9MICO
MLPEVALNDSFGSRLPLARASIDRDHLSRTLGIEALLADPLARVVVLHDRLALLAEPGRLALLSPGEVPSHDLALYLGRAVADEPGLAVGAPVVALLVDDEVAATLSEGSASAAWGDLRLLGSELSTRDAGLFTEALALANWHASYGFSPRTGRPSAPDAAGWTRRDIESGAELFPRTDAAIIVGITDDDDRLLLGSNALWEKNRFSLLAGFVEPGESLEAAVIREVYEESGVRVTDPVYQGSQPWPFPASLMVGFRARVADGASTIGRPDGEEILELRWFTRDELAAAMGEIRLPGSTSIARAIIDDWYGGELPDRGRW